MSRHRIDHDHNEASRTTRWRNGNCWGHIELDEDDRLVFVVDDVDHELDPLPAAPSRPGYVYVASSWRNATQPAVVEAITGAGIDAYDFRHPEPGDDGFAWSEIDPAWQSWTAEQYVEALDHPRAVEGFGKDIAAMQRADTFVLVLPCGRSAHLELGWAVGVGKRTAILLNGNHEPELMAKMVDHIAVDLPDLMAWLTDPA